LTTDPLLCTDFCDLVPRSISSPYASASIKPEKPYGFYFNSATIMISKMTDLSFGAAIKAGGNGNHSHNDIGSYTIAVGGKTITGDAGGPKKYTGDVFSRKRYTFPILNSYGHPVPYIDGQQQALATKVKPIVLCATQNEKQDSFIIDMRPAYPSVKDMTMIERDYRVDREARTVTIEDRFSATENKTFETAIVLTGSFKTKDSTTLELINDQQSIQAHVAASAPVELVPEKLPNFGSEFTRIAVRFKEPLQKGSVKIIYMMR
jgi:RES domain-containing protein